MSFAVNLCSNAYTLAHYELCLFVCVCTHLYERASDNNMNIRTFSSTSFCECVRICLCINCHLSKQNRSRIRLQRYVCGIILYWNCEKKARRTHTLTSQTKNANAYDCRKKTSDGPQRLTQKKYSIPYTRRPNTCVERYAWISTQSIVTLLSFLFRSQ